MKRDEARYQIALIRLKQRNLPTDSEEYRSMEQQVFDLLAGSSSE